MLPSWLNSWFIGIMDWLMEYALYWATGKTYLQRVCYNYQAHERTVNVERRLAQSTCYPVRQALTGDTGIDIEQVVLEICRVEGVKTSEEDKFTAQLRESVVQIHNVASLLAEAQSLKSSPYCSENSTHEESLLELWSLLKPDEPLTDRISNQWGEIGFQGNDPATDFRGMGYLGLLNIVYFARHRPENAKLILLHSQHPTIGYGFAIAGVNLTSLIFELFKSNDLQGYFYREFAHREVTLRDLHDVFCLLFEQFDKFWIAKEPESVMAFNVVREEFKQSLQAMLRTSCSLSLPVEQLTRR